MRKTLFILLFLTGLTVKSVLAQKQANIWHYGQNHCLDFSSGAPVYISGSPMSTFEGSASYSDQHGNLLFFTNGGGGVFNAPGLPFSMPGAIWNRNNAVMHAIPNGSGGGNSATQSAVIFEAPCQDSIYYMFTMQEVESMSPGTSPGLSFFTIDRRLNGGLGGVVIAGMPINNISVEALCAIKHANGRDYWIIAYMDSLGLGVYRVSPMATSLGISQNGVYDFPGFVSGGVHSFRFIKSNPSGDRLMAVFYDAQGKNIHSLFHFNNSTGQLSNPQQIYEPGISKRMGSFEFSPNGKYLYILQDDDSTFTANNSLSILRFDLQAANINASATTISQRNVNGNYGAMQLAPDGNIYFMEHETTIPALYVHRMVCTNSANPGIDLQILNTPAFGFPTFPSWLFESDDDQYVSLGPDTVYLCDVGGSYVLNAQNPGASYLWSTGATTQTITVNSPGLYSVTVNGSCGSGNDEIVLLNCPAGLVKSADVCAGDTMTFSYESRQVIRQIQWDFGDPGSGSSNTSSNIFATHVYSTTGTYTVSVIVEQPCSVDTITTTVQIGGYLSPLIAVNACERYTAPWGTVYTQSGIYVDTLLTQNGCDSITRINLNISGFPDVSVVSTPNSCEANNGTASASANGGGGNYSFLWSNGASGSSISGLQAGNYSVTVTDQFGCTDSAFVNVGSRPTLDVRLSATNTIITKGDSVSISLINGLNHEWSPADGLNCVTCATVMASPAKTTTYVVTGLDSNGCAYSRSITIQVDIICHELFIPDIFTPNGMGKDENEKICVYGNCIELMSLEIYNRWGEVVFSTDRTDECWDGTFKGTPALSGVYAYRFYAERKDGQQIERTGNIHLIR